jgi:hypothetical protein
MRRCLLFHLLFLSVCAVHAQTTVSLGPSVDVNGPGQGGLRPRVVVNAAGDPVVLWGRATPAGNRVAVGNGSGFEVSVPVHLPGIMLPAVSYWQGSSIAASGNTVWVVMKATPEDQWSIYARRSDDGGYTWGDTIRVPPHNGLLSRFPVIAVEDPDRPVVQYMEFADGFLGARYVVSRMQDGAFQEPVQVSAPFAPGYVCDCCPAQVVAQDDRVAALYRNAGNDERVMWGAFSSDGGESFPFGAKLDTTNWYIAQCMSSGPDGYITGDSITYVWMSGALLGSKVYVGRASMLTGGIGNHRRIHGQPQAVVQNYPRVAGTGDTLGVVWQQSSGGATEVMFSWSVTGLDDLSEPVIVNTVFAGMQRTPDIHYAEGAFHIVWDEMELEQVRYRKATLEGAVALPGLVADAAYRALPNPCAGSVYTNAPEGARVRVMDLAGRQVTDTRVADGRIDLSALPASIYFLEMSVRGEAHARIRVCME